MDFSGKLVNRVETWQIKRIDILASSLKILRKNGFPCHFKKMIVRHKKIGYNIDVLRQTACLVVNPIKVNSFAYLFNCTTVGRASD